jgi:hypothetical protein
MDAADDHLFEALYQQWLKRGIDQPAITESMERFVRTGGQTYAPTPCKHGKTLLTCNVCYFEEWGKDDGA